MFEVEMSSFIIPLMHVLCICHVGFVQADVVLLYTTPLFKGLVKSCMSRRKTERKEVKNVVRKYPSVVLLLPLPPFFSSQGYLPIERGLLEAAKFV